MPSSILDVSQESTLYNDVFCSYRVLYHKQLAGNDALRTRMFSALNNNHEHSRHSPPSLLPLRASCCFKRAY